MPELFDKQTAPITLAAEELAKAGRNIPPAERRRQGDIRLTEAEWLRRLWSQKIGRLYFINQSRFRSICLRLDQGFTAWQLALAICAYGEEMKTAWRVKNPTAKKSFEDFLLSDRLDMYIEMGEQIHEQKQNRRQADMTQARRQHDERTQAERDRAERDRIWKLFEQMDIDDKRQLRRAAEEQTSLQRSNPAYRTAVKFKIIELMQERGE